MTAGMSDSPVWTAGRSAMCSSSPIGPGGLACGPLASWTDGSSAPPSSAQSRHRSCGVDWQSCHPERISTTTRTGGGERTFVAPHESVTLMSINSVSGRGSRLRWRPRRGRQMARAWPSSVAEPPGDGATHRAGGSDAQDRRGARVRLPRPVIAQRPVWFHTRNAILVDFMPGLGHRPRVLRGRRRIRPLYAECAA